MVDKTSKERQAKRRSQLNEIARAAGFPSWTKLETALLEKKISLGSFAGGAPPPSGKRSKKKKEDGLDRVLRNHSQMCSTHIYSGPRLCSCGLEEAREIVSRLRKLEEESPSNP